MVRLMHSMVRVNVLSRPGMWDVETYGMPIPQLDHGFDPVHPEGVRGPHGEHYGGHHMFEGKTGGQGALQMIEIDVVVLADLDADGLVLYVHPEQGEVGDVGVGGGKDRGEIRGAADAAEFGRGVVQAVVRVVGQRRSGVGGRDLEQVDPVQDRNADLCRARIIGADVHHHVGIVDSAVKRRVLVEEALRLGENVPTLATGDGANDIPMIEAATWGIAYRAKPKARSAADGWIDRGDLTAILSLLGIPRDEWVAG